MKLRSLAVTLVLLVVQLPVAVLARVDKPAGWIELRGSYDSHVDVTFTERVKIACCNSDVTEDGTRIIFPGISVRTKGSYAGYLIERISDGKLMVGGVRIREMNFHSLQMVVQLTKDTRATLEPGRYRVHLLADGESTVRFRVSGLRGPRVFHPTARTEATGSLEPLAPAPGVPLSVKKVPVDVGRETLVLIASYVSTIAGQVNYLDQCMGHFTDVCQMRGDDSWFLFTSPGAIGSGIAIASVYAPGRLSKGEWHATFSQASAGVVEKATSFVLTFR